MLQGGAFEQLLARQFDVSQRRERMQVDVFDKVARRLRATSTSDRRCGLDCCQFKLSGVQGAHGSVSVLALLLDVPLTDASLEPMPTRSTTEPQGK